MYIANYIITNTKTILPTTPKKLYYQLIMEYEVKMSKMYNISVCNHLYHLSFILILYRSKLSKSCH